MSRTDPPMKIRLPEALKAAIQQAATDGRRSMNSEIVTRLEQSFGLTGSEPISSPRAVDGNTKMSLDDAAQEIREREVMQRLEKLESEIAALRRAK